MTEEMLRLVESPSRSPVQRISIPTPLSPPADMSMDFSDEKNAAYITLLMEDF